MERLTRTTTTGDGARLTENEYKDVLAILNKAGSTRLLLYLREQNCPIAAEAIESLQRIFNVGETK